MLALVPRPKATVLYVGRLLSWMLCDAAHDLAAYGGEAALLAIVLQAVRSQRGTCAEWHRCHQRHLLVQTSSSCPPPPLTTQVCAHGRAFREPFLEATTVLAMCHDGIRH